jgi:MFS transporter, FHS family, glucose/mannose:H+ symporter
MTNENRALVLLLHFAFFLTGISTVLIGQVLPILSSKLALDDEQLGQLFIAQFVGSVTGVFVFNYLLGKFGFLKTILFGLISFGLAALLINADLPAIVYLGFFINGIGAGTSLPAINMFIAELNLLRQARALNVLNFFWGFGAIVSQPFVAFFGSPKSILPPTLLLSISFFLLTLTIIFSAARTGSQRIEKDSNEIVSVPIWNHPAAWLIAFFNFLNVGLESGMGGWLTTYSARFGGGESHWLSATPVFFLFFVIGRAFAPLSFRLLDENRFIFTSLLIFITGIVLIILARDYLLLFGGAAVAGFGTAAVFPTNLARFTKFFGERAMRNGTPFFVCGSLGGAFVTWLIGFVSNSSGNLRSGIYVLLGSSLVLIFLQIFISRSPRLSKGGI